MRSYDDNAPARRAPALAALALALTLAGCGMLGGGGADALPVAQAQTGPAADYPVVVGEPYRAAGVLYTPTDTLNYDEVGYASLDGAGGDAVSAAHHTLPLPSYVEVTSLASGRTILVRLERRGPMDDTSLIALSPGAVEQLGVVDKAPVRVRRVNPPEPERAALRMGGRATDRLETPETLLAVLRRKLPAQGSAALASAASVPPTGDAPDAAAPAAPSPTAVAAARPAPTTTPAAASELAPLPPLAVATTPRQAPQAAPARPAPPTAQPPAAAPRAAPPPAVAANGAYVVQAGAYSTADRAQKVADVIGGSVTRTGSLFRVRTGPFASRTQAEASLAKVRAAGYSEARIFTNG